MPSCPCIFLPPDILLADLDKYSYIILESLVGQRGRKEDWVTMTCCTPKIDPLMLTDALYVVLSQKWTWITDSIGRWMSRPTLTTSLPFLSWWLEQWALLGMPWSCTPFSGRHLVDFPYGRGDSEECACLPLSVLELHRCFSWTTFYNVILGIAQEENICPITFVYHE